MERSAHMPGCIGLPFVFLVGVMLPLWIGLLILAGALILYALVLQFPPVTLGILLAGYFFWLIQQFKRPRDRLRILVLLAFFLVLIGIGVNQGVFDSNWLDTVQERFTANPIIWSITMVGALGSIFYVTVRGIAAIEDWLAETFSSPGSFLRNVLGCLPMLIFLSFVVLIAWYSWTLRTQIP